LAPLLVRETFGVIARLKEQGVPILLVEQNVKAALSIADVGYVLETGAIAIHGPARQLLNDERVTSSYLGC
jgi:ABC-type branched-chain amino acid transport systems, ATPase component